MGTKIELADNEITSGNLDATYFVPVGKVGITTSMKVSMEELKLYIASVLDKIIEDDSSVEVIDSGGTKVIRFTIDNGILFNIIPTALSPQTTDAFDIGTTAKMIRDIYMAGGFKLGSDANGDIYYNNGGNLIRLGIGSASDVLTVVAGLPAWTALGATPARWADMPNFVYASSSSFTSTTLFGVGTPIRYRTGSGVYRYGIITAVSTGSPNVYTINGYPIDAGNDDYEYGNSDLVHVENIHIDGAYEDAAIVSGATGGLLYEDLNASNHYVWRKPVGHIVSLIVSHKTNDSGSNNPTIMVKTSTNNSAFSAALSAPITITTGMTTSLVTINTANVVAYGNYIEFDITQGVGAAGDASDLDIQLVFITE